MLKADDARGDDYPSTRIFIGKTINRSGNLAPQGRVENFVETIKQQQTGIGSQPCVKLGPVKVPTYARTILKVIEKVFDQSLVTESCVFAQFNEERQRLSDKIGAGMLSPNEEEILEQNGLTGTRITENDQPLQSRVADNLEDRVGAIGRGRHGDVR